MKSVANPTPAHFGKVLTLALLVTLASMSAFAQAIKLTSERQTLAEAATKERMAYAHSKNYQPYDMDVRDARKAAWKLIDQHSFHEAVTSIDKALATHPVDIELSMAKAAALNELKDASAAQARARWMSLADSILTSGDGKSFATAFRVISVDEEYVVLRLLGLQNSRQVLQHDHGSMYDVLTVHRKDNDKSIDLYFNVDLPMAELNRQFQPKS